MQPAEAGKTFHRATLGRTGLRMGRLGVAASYGVPAAAVERAFEQGANYFYWGTLRRGGFGDAIRQFSAVYSRKKPPNRCGLVACAIGPRNINECLQLAPIHKRSARGSVEKAEPGG